MGFNFKANAVKKAGGRKYLPFIFACLPLVFLLIFTHTAFAAKVDYSQDLNDFLNIEIKPWANSDIIIDNLNKQNDVSAGYTESSLKLMDNNWHSEVRKVNQPLITQVMTSDLSQFLQKKKDDSTGVITELKIMDAKGLNIAQTVVSDTYWNVGLPIWDKTFKAKSYATYISDVYYSDETNKFQVEVSFMIINGDQPVGVIAAGINVEQLEDWKKQRK